MSKAKMQAAKELIQEKRFEEARAVLMTVDDPQARDWVAKLDQKTPPIKKENSGGMGRTLLVGLLFLAVGAILGFVVRGSLPSEVQLAAVPTSLPSATSSATLPPTATPSKTATATPSNTPTPTSSPTITSTPTPTLTLTPTNTETPANTSTPSPIPPGTRSNPYPLGTLGSIRGGRFRVNYVMRNMTAAVLQVNEFNTLPDPGEEWVVANVTFVCDMTPDEICESSFMQFDLAADSGNIYEYEAVVLDNPFDSDIFGGGELTGNVGFIINQSERNLLFAVNDLGDRIFFKGS